MYGGEYALAQARWQKEEEMEQRMRLVFGFSTFDS